jgi:hypothetical protein
MPLAGLRSGVCTELFLKCSILACCFNALRIARRSASVTGGGVMVALRDRLAKDRPRTARSAIPDILTAAELHGIV